MLLHAFQRAQYATLNIYWTLHFSLSIDELTELTLSRTYATDSTAYMWLSQYRKMTGMLRRPLHCVTVANPLALPLLKSATLDDDVAAVSALVDMFMEEGREMRQGWRSKEKYRIPASLEALSKILAENPFALTEVVRPPGENVVEEWLDASGRYNNFDEDSQFD